MQSVSLMSRCFMLFKAVSQQRQNKLIQPFVNICSIGFIISIHIDAASFLLPYYYYTHCIISIFCIFAAIMCLLRTPTIPYSKTTVLQRFTHFSYFLNQILIVPFMVSFFRFIFTAEVSYSVGSVFITTFILIVHPQDVIFNRILPVLILLFTIQIHYSLGIAGIIFALQETNTLRRVLYTIVGVLAFGYVSYDQKYKAEIVYLGLSLVGAMVIAFFWKRIEAPKTTVQKNKFVLDIIQPYLNDDDALIQKVLSKETFVIIKQIIKDESIFKIRQVKPKDILRALKEKVNRQMKQSKQQPSKNKFEEQLFRLKLNQQPLNKKVIIAHNLLQAYQGKINLKQKYQLCRTLLEFKSQIKASAMICRFFQAEALSKQFYVTYKQCVQKLIQFWEIISKQNKSNKNQGLDQHIAKQIQHIIKQLLPLQKKITQIYRQFETLNPSTRQKLMMNELQLFLNHYNNLEQPKNKKNSLNFHLPQWQRINQLQSISYILSFDNTIIDISTNLSQQLQQEEDQQQQILHKNIFTVFPVLLHDFIREQIQSAGCHTRFLLPLVTSNGNIIMKWCTVYLCPSVQIAIAYLFHFQRNSAANVILLQTHSCLILHSSCKLLSLPPPIRGQSLLKLLSGGEVSCDEFLSGKTIKCEWKNTIKVGLKLVAAITPNVCLLTLSQLIPDRCEKVKKETRLLTKNSYISEKYFCPIPNAYGRTINETIAKISGKHSAKITLRIRNTLVIILITMVVSIAFIYLYDRQLITDNIQLLKQNEEISQEYNCIMEIYIEVYFSVFLSSTVEERIKQTKWGVNQIEIHNQLQESITNQINKIVKKKNVMTNQTVRLQSAANIAHLTNAALIGFLTSNPNMLFINYQTLIKQGINHENTKPQFVNNFILLWCYVVFIGICLINIIYNSYYMHYYMQQIIGIFALITKKQAQACVQKLSFLQSNNLENMQHQLDRLNLNFAKTIKETKVQRRLSIQNASETIFDTTEEYLVNNCTSRKQEPLTVKQQDTQVKALINKICNLRKHWVSLLIVILAITPLLFYNIEHAPSAQLIYQQMLEYFSILQTYKLKCNQYMLNLLHYSCLKKQTPNTTIDQSIFAPYILTTFYQLPLFFHSLNNSFNACLTTSSRIFSNITCANVMYGVLNEGIGQASNQYSATTLKLLRLANVSKLWSEENAFYPTILQCLYAQRALEAAASMLIYNFLSKVQQFLLLEANYSLRGIIVAILIAVTMTLYAYLYNKLTHSRTSTIKAFLMFPNECLLKMKNTRYLRKNNILDKIISL